jgi:hypothetical protein
MHIYIKKFVRYVRVDHFGCFVDGAAHGRDEEQRDEDGGAQHGKIVLEAEQDTKIPRRHIVHRVPEVDFGVAGRWSGLFSLRVQRDGKDGCFSEQKQQLEQGKVAQRDAT